MILNSDEIELIDELYHDEVPLSEIKKRIFDFSRKKITNNDVYKALDSIYGKQYRKKKYD